MNKSAITPADIERIEAYCAKVAPRDGNAHYIDLNEWAGHASTALVRDLPALVVAVRERDERIAKHVEYVSRLTNGINEAVEERIKAERERDELRQYADAVKAVLDTNGALVTKLQAERDELQADVATLTRRCEFLDESGEGLRRQRDELAAKLAHTIDQRDHADKMALDALRQRDAAREALWQVDACLREDGYGEVSRVRALIDAALADASPAEPRTAGQSTCPVCGRHWLVTPYDDCMVPACGCFGTDTGQGNRPCHGCGMSHANTCAHMPSRRAGTGRAAEDPTEGCTQSCTHTTDGSVCAKCMGCGMEAGGFTGEDCPDCAGTGREVKP